MSCICGGSQRSESDGETTLEEGGRDSPSKRAKVMSMQGRQHWLTCLRVQNIARKMPDRNRKRKFSDLPQQYIVIPFLQMSGKKLDPTTPNQTIESCRDPCETQSDSDIRIRKSYVMSYNKDTKNADWVYEILNEKTLEINCKDTRTFGKNEFEDRDYDQGHLAAAANHRWCQEAYHDTYLLSNMVPQDKSLNNSDWKKIENYCRNTAKNPDVCNVHVYTGPLYLKEKENTWDDEEQYEPADHRQLSGEKKVPSHLFKVIIVENKDGTVNLEGCVVPELDNKGKKGQKDKKDLEESINFYSQPPERIERLSGLKFISHSTVVTDSIETIKWTGEGETGELCSVEIKVRISSVQDESHQMFIPNRNIHLR